MLSQWFFAIACQEDEQTNQFERMEVNLLDLSVFEWTDIVGDSPKQTPNKHSLDSTDSLKVTHQVAPKCPDVGWKIFHFLLGFGLLAAASGI